ncbi:MAG: hypothetical protein Q8L05_11095 [Actinomycetota bacterium]|nr:hypothetical protein [Actinomycetota bacterium]MDP2289466.1 hypothetical protein [Actinomycetota bacterium]
MSAGSHPRTAAVVTTTLLAATLVASASLPALAATAAPRKSPSMTVSATTKVKSGQAVKVRGSGFDTSKGIYVAFCVAPKPGLAPTPCGGAPGSESVSSAVWISSNPPSYGKSMTTPFGKGGTFAVPITVTSMIGEIDCRVTRCGIAARADHRRSQDRSQDVFIPVTFG